MKLKTFNSLWELDDVRTLPKTPTIQKWTTPAISFNSLWELDDVRTRKTRGRRPTVSSTFNSLWELDGVRTLFHCPIPYLLPHKSFNSLWELDDVRTRQDGGGPGQEYSLSIPCGN